VGDGFHGGGGDMTMVLLDVMMLGILAVVLILWMSNMVNMMMIVVMLTIRYMLMIVCYKGTTLV
jgi:hypothetical protein